MPFQASQGSQPLACGDNGVMVRNLLIIHIPGLFNAPEHFFLQYLPDKIACRPEILQSSDILLYLLGHCGGKYPGIRSGVGHQLLFIQLLDNPQRFVRADLKHPGAVVLQFRQIVEQRRIFLFFLPLDGTYPGLRRLYPLQLFFQLQGILFFLKSVFFIKSGGQIVSGASHSPEFSFKFFPAPEKSIQNPVKRRFDKLPDLPFPPDNHAQHAGHHPSHGNNAVPLPQIA